MKFESKVIHAGVNPDPSTGAIMTPIYQTSTYVQKSPGNHQGYEYARTQNPTRTALQDNLAALEGGKFGICFGSGLAAMDAVLQMLDPGDEIIATNDLYGGSYRLITRIHGRYGIKAKFVDMSKPSGFGKHIGKKTKMVWIETPTNPMLNIVDIAAISKIAKSKGALVVVDNTFASPYLQTPLTLGADIIVHSATKYLGGHSDVVLGAVVVKKKSLADQLYFTQNAVGAVPGPQDCFLVLRGIKTLHVRVDRACKNAKKVAKYLQGHPKVGNVYYPGFKSHPGHELAKKQMRDFGGMVSFDLSEDKFIVAQKVLSATQMFALAESLGGVESLIGHPASMTHSGIPKKDRLKVGLTDSLIRLSVGIEHVEDLIEDLEMALNEI